jgi:uncharacterized protein YcfL
MKTYLKAYALITCSALALTGCETAPPPEGGYRIDNQNAVNPTLDTVRVIDGDLARYKDRKYQVRSVLDVEHVTLSRTETGFPRISVELRNKSAYPIPLEVRTSWYDGSGRPIDMASSWGHVFAQPMAMALYEQISIKPDAVHYYIEIRGAE